MASPPSKSPSRAMPRDTGGMVIILCTMFLGITVLASAYHIIPDGSPQPETANSQLARAILGSGHSSIMRYKSPLC